MTSSMIKPIKLHIKNKTDLANIEKAIRGAYKERNKSLLTCPNLVRKATKKEIKDICKSFH